MADCSVMQIAKKAMLRFFTGARVFRYVVAYLLTRNLRYEEDWLTSFQFREKRLARILLCCLIRQGRKA